MVEVLDRVTMQFFVRCYYAMIAAPVQCDVDRMPKGLHYVRILPIAVDRLRSEFVCRYPLRK